MELNDPSETGIVFLSVFHDSKSADVIDMMSTDVMHDVLERTVLDDSALILHIFIDKEFFFSLEDLDKRLMTFDYGNDEKDNKPAEITPCQIQNQFIKMLATESLCFIRNIGVLIEDLVPPGNVYWKVIIHLKEIVDIVTSPVVYRGLADYLDSVVHDYLNLLTKLFTNFLKPKHHFLLYNASVMKKLGPLWNICTMRCESRNRIFRITAGISQSRKNIFKTLAIKSQLRMCHRVLASTETYKDEVVCECECESFKMMKVYELPIMSDFFDALPITSVDNVRVFDLIIYKNRHIPA